MKQAPKRILIVGPARTRTSMILSGFCQGGATGLYEPWHPEWRIRMKSREAHNSDHIPIWRKGCNRFDYIANNPDIVPHEGGNGVIAVKTISSQHVSGGPGGAKFSQLRKIATDWADIVIITNRDIMERIGSFSVKLAEKARWNQWNQGGSGVNFQEGSFDVPEQSIRRAINAEMAALCLTKLLVRDGHAQKLIAVGYKDIPTPERIRDLLRLRGVRIPFGDPLTEPHASGHCPERFLSIKTREAVSRIRMEMRDSPWRSAAR